jgi:hypothetical protein
MQSNKKVTTAPSSGTKGAKESIDKYELSDARTDHLGHLWDTAIDGVEKGTHADTRHVYLFSLYCAKEDYSRHDCAEAICLRSENLPASIIHELINLGYQIVNG